MPLGYFEETFFLENPKSLNNRDSGLLMVKDKGFVLSINLLVQIAYDKQLFPMETNPSLCLIL